MVNVRAFLELGQRAIVQGAGVTGPRHRSIIGSEFQTPSKNNKFTKLKGESCKKHASSRLAKKETAAAQSSFVNLLHTVWYATMENNSEIEIKIK